MNSQTVKIKKMKSCNILIIDSDVYRELISEWTQMKFVCFSISDGQSVGFFLKQCNFFRFVSIIQFNFVMLWCRKKQIR